MAILYDKIIEAKIGIQWAEIFHPSIYFSMNAHYNKKTSPIMSHHTIFKHWKNKSNSQTSCCESWL